MAVLHSRCGKYGISSTLTMVAGIYTSVPWHGAQLILAERLQGALVNI